jgi:hypothetical protein
MWTLTQNFFKKEKIMPKVKYTAKKGLVQTAGSGVDLVTGLKAGNGVNMRRPTVESSASTLAPTVAQSGTLFLLTTNAAVTVTLPAAEAGLHYEFQIPTTKTGTLTINAASDADTLTGAIMMTTVGAAVATNAGVTTAFASPAASDHQYVASAATKGRNAGTHLVYKCTSATIWSVSGLAISAGTAATPWT